MAVIERDIVLMSRDADGNQTIDLPLTRLGNVEDTADAKTTPVDADFVPVIDSADGGQMKKTTVAALAGCVAKTSGLTSHMDDTTQHITAAERSAWNAQQTAVQNLQTRMETLSVVSSTQPTNQAVGGIWLQPWD